MGSAAPTDITGAVPTRGGAACNIYMSARADAGGDDDLRARGIIDFERRWARMHERILPTGLARQARSASVRDFDATWADVFYAQGRLARRSGQRWTATQFAPTARAPTDPFWVLDALRGFTADDAQEGASSPARVTGHIDLRHAGDLPGAFGLSRWRAWLARLGRTWETSFPASVELDSDGRLSAIAYARDRLWLRLTLDGYLADPGLTDPLAPPPATA
jgi:hypothetical protein